MHAAVDFFTRGGWAMWLLLTCAIIGFAYVIERLITFARIGVDPEDFAEKLIKIFKESGISSAIGYCRKVPSPAANVLRPTLEKFKQVGKEREVLEETLTRSATRGLAFLDRGMLILASLSNIAPMIGFLGTVSGMIRAFNSIALAGTVEPTLVASGISEALITTATGLGLAIPISAAHAFFSTKVNAFTRSMEDAASAVMDTILEA
ncbi:MAG: MotA/TolQ/ExbB proton channel family protein [candidate division WOR-3 bacterium]|nr:MotA/TolQ/ExbB proton channel family protein [candidate division WOR-3 bacterium]